MKKTILVVAAHPDDEIIGCGGTLARLIDDGHNVYVLILSEGVYSRDYMGDLSFLDYTTQLASCAKEANKHLGVKEVFTFSFPDNNFDGVSLLSIIKEVEKIKRVVRPDIVFTHYYNDLNIDHRLTYSAVITATRPTINESVKEIYSFEILSSTEWNYPTLFSPNMFYNITNTIDKKLYALDLYKQEMREFPHPRSIDGVKTNCKIWGMKVGVEFAEAFEVVRIVK